MASIKAIELAAQFRERAEAHDGSIWLSAKQVKFLASLASPVYRGVDERNVGPVVMETVHGWPIISAFFDDGEVWSCKVMHNGAGAFGRDRMWK